MSKSEQPRSDSRTDWRVRLTTAAGAGLGATLALLAGPLFDMHLSLLWGMIGFGAFLVVGILLGQLVGSLLFRRKPEQNGGSEPMG
jgi:hypothetical protein